MRKLGILLLTFFLLTGCGKEEPFYLNEEYYGTSNITEIAASELQELEEQQASFVVFVYQPMCTTSSNFETVLNEFIAEEQLSIYKISFSNSDNTSIREKIRFYPSAVIYHDGKVVDALDAGSDEDTPYFESVEGFKEWLTKYVLLKEE